MLCLTTVHIQFGSDFSRKLTVVGMVAVQGFYLVSGNNIDSINMFLGQLPLTAPSNMTHPVFSLTFEPSGKTHVLLNKCT